jgi:crotonobetainyl-CoA:carnitine CoA-transferase CaiB-like acyl-CoA transferase
MGGATDGRRALDGVRILDLSQVAIGPYATFLLVSLGAQVIKVESHRRADTSRGPVEPVTESQRNQYPGKEPGERPWNRTAFFNQRNRGKLGITLDFTTSAGKQLLTQLVAVSDALVENFRASVLDRQGLGWDTLKEVNPRLVYLKLSSQGASGPERDYGSLGSTLEQTGGIASITGYTDGVPLLTNETYPDPVAAILGAGALIAGLRRVRRTGRGQFVDLSQREVTAAVLGEAMMDYALNGRVAAPIGNRHPSMAPHGVYPCRVESSRFTPPPGRWIAIAVADDAQWRGLCRAMGDPAWCADPRFATVNGRWHYQDEIDTHLSGWTAGHDHIALTHLLQRHGVPAGAVLDGVELLADEQLVARSWWDHVTPPDIGRPFPMISPPWRLSGSPYRPLPPAPRLGEHNDEVIRDLLGIDDEQYAAYRTEGVISTEAAW